MQSQTLSISLLTDIKTFSIASSNGKEFYIGFMGNIGGTDFTTLRVSIGTVAESADYRIEDRDRVIQTGTVQSGRPVTVDISSALLVEDSTFQSREKGLHISTSTSNATIFILAENFLSPINHGVFLAYPCLTFANTATYEYYAISTMASEFLRSLVLLVGCEDDTAITITTTQSITLPQDVQVNGSPTLTLTPGSSHNVSLGQMQTLLIVSDSDLTGTKITSNKPLTVISGHECANVPFSESGCEPLAVHVPASITWGNTFMTVPLAGRTAQPSFKFISTEAATVVISCPTETRLFPSATNFEFSTSEYCFIESTKPLLGVEFATGGSLDRQGDPAVTLVSPVKQYINQATFLTLSTSEFPSNFISVTVPIESYNPEEILLDSNPIACEWSMILKDSQLEEPEIVGYGCSKAVSSGRNTPTEHTVSHMASDGLLSVIAYGFNARRSRGYAYLAGQLISVGKFMAMKFN